MMAVFRYVGPSSLAKARAMVRLLGESGVPLSLDAFVVLGDIERVKQLLKDEPHLAGSSFVSMSPLRWAVALNQPEMVVALLDGGVSVSGRTSLIGPTALHDTARGDNAAIAKILIERKADVNVRDQYGCTPLHEATSNNAPKVARLLLEAKAEVSPRDKYGATPLHRAVEKKDLVTTEVLLGAGADVNAKDDKGETPLDKANPSNKELIELFKKYGGK
jgi:ankyrin repeat protein